MNRTAAFTVAAVLAVTAALVLKKGLSRDLDARQAAEEPIQVVVASRDIAPGTPLTSDDISPGEIPRRALAPSTITAEYGTSIKGQTLVRARRKGDQIAWFDLSEHGRGLAAAVPAGERAVTVGVDERSGLAGMLKPNDHVDVLLVASQPIGKDGSTERSFARLMLPNVTVLAAGARTGLDAPGTDEAGYTTVTLACTPEEAVVLALAQSKGEVVLILRNPDEAGGLEPGTAVDLDEVLSGRAAAALARQRQKK